MQSISQSLEITANTSSSTYWRTTESTQKKREIRISSTNIPMNSLPNLHRRNFILSFPTHKLKYHVLVAVELLPPRHTLSTCIRHRFPEYTPPNSRMNHRTTTHHTWLMRCVEIISWSIMFRPITLVATRNCEKIDCRDDGMIYRVLGGYSGVVGCRQNRRSGGIYHQRCDGEIV